MDPPRMEIDNLWDELEEVDEFGQNLRWGYYHYADKEQIEQRDEDFRKIGVRSITPFEDFDVYISEVYEREGYFVVMPDVHDIDIDDSPEEYRQRCLEILLTAGDVLSSLEYYLYLDKTLNPFPQIAITSIPREDLAFSEDVVLYVELSSMDLFYHPEEDDEIRSDLIVSEVI